MQLTLEQYLYAVGTQGILILAEQEAAWSNLPGKNNGPWDAYRHILLSAELTREFGEDYARLLLDSHELTGNYDGQTAESESMDIYNNELGIEIGNRLRENPDFPTSEQQFCESITQGDDLSDIWDEMMENALNRDGKYPYDLASQNCGTINLTEDTGNAGNLNFSLFRHSVPRHGIQFRGWIPYQVWDDEMAVNNEKFEKVRSVA